MASYGALLRMVPTSEINRLLREKQYTRWAYFIDEDAIKVGVVFANDTEFGAYIVLDEPDPKLHVYGLEAITDLECVPDPKYLVVSAGEHQLRAAVFNDPMTVIDDEYLPTFSYAAAADWQKFLSSRRIAVAEDPRRSRIKRIYVTVVVLLVLAVMAFAVFG